MSNPIIELDIRADKFHAKTVVNGVKFFASAETNVKAIKKIEKKVLDYFSSEVRH